MCVTFIIAYVCGHGCFLDYPNILTKCPDMIRVSTTLHPVVCPGNKIQPVPSTSVCPDCSNHFRRLEHRYRITRVVYEAGGKVKRMDALGPREARLWICWREERERFRKVGVNGGKGGELGQGKWDPATGMWEEMYEFDGVVGEMGPFELAKPMGLQVTIFTEALESMLVAEEGPIKEGVQGKGEKGGKEEGEKKGKGEKGRKEEGEKKGEENDADEQEVQNLMKDLLFNAIGNLQRTVIKDMAKEEVEGAKNKNAGDGQQKKREESHGEGPKATLRMASLLRVILESCGLTVEQEVTKGRVSKRE